MALNRKVLLGVAAAGVFAAIAWAFAPRPLPVEASAAVIADFEEFIEEDGQTRLRNRYIITAPVAARVMRSTLREGDTVAAGDLVALLAPGMASMLDTRSTQEAAARLRSATAGIERAAARVARAEVQLEESRHALSRDERLARDGFVSAARLDTAQLAVAGAERELQMARAERDVALYERAQAAAAVAPAPAASGGSRPIGVRSPVSGVVLKVSQQNETNVAPGAALLEVGDITQLEVVADLLTTDAVRAPSGTRVVIERWGGPPVEGVVRRVEPGAFTKISALGIEEQRVRVLIDPLTPAPEWRGLGDGFRVTVRVITTHADGALQVPVGAVFPHGDRHAVYRLDRGRARLQPIVLGGRNGSMAWIREGLAAGQQVILYPPANVVEARRVKVRAP